MNRVKTTDEMPPDVGKRIKDAVMDYIRKDIEEKGKSDTRE